MAILRGGTRIFGQDIRIGLPRDKSLVNVAGDKRLQRRPGNPESTIGRFIAEMNQGEGVARPSRFLAVFHMPKRSQLGAGWADEFDMSSPRNDLESITMERNVGMMCNKITLPSRDVNTAENRTYGPARRMPYAYSFSGELQANFIGDKFLRQRQFFENWQKKIFDNTSHDMKYYDDYIGVLDIYQLGAFAGNADRDRVSYAVRLHEVYPQTIGSLEYDYSATDQAVQVPITLNFRTWTNLTIDQIDGATVGKKIGDVPTVKAAKDFGMFGGILSNLPPELQRAGRDILQTTRRNLPIGKLTGGRVFPPFL